MKIFIHLSVFFTLLNLITSTKYYITDELRCISSCSGSSFDPFDSLLYAFSNLDNSNHHELFLLKPNSNGHYIMTTENTTSGLRIFHTDFVFTSDITLSPLYCDGNEPPELSSRCFQPGETATIFLKTENITWSFSAGGLTLSKIVIDGSENIERVNLANPSFDINTCLMNRIRCCDPAVISGASLYRCSISDLSEEDSLFSKHANSSILNFLDTNSYKSLSIIDSSIINMLMLSKSIFLSYGKNVDVDISGMFFQALFFREGIFKQTFISTQAVQRNFKISNSTFSYILSTNFTGTQGMVLSTYSNLNIKYIFENLLFEYFTIRENQFFFKFSSSNADFYNCSINRFATSPTANSYQGIFFSEESTLMISDLNFNENYVYNNFRGILARSNSKVQLSRVNFDDNAVAINQGDSYFFKVEGDSSLVIEDITVHYTIYSSTSRDYEFIFFYADPYTQLSILNFYFDFNIFAGRSGIIYAHFLKNLTLLNLNITNNEMKGIIDITNKHIDINSPSESVIQGILYLLMPATYKSYFLHIEGEVTLSQIESRAVLFENSGGKIFDQAFIKTVGEKKITLRDVKLIGNFLLSYVKLIDNQAEILVIENIEILKSELNSFDGNLKATPSFISSINTLKIYNLTIDYYYEEKIASNMILIQPNSILEIHQALIQNVSPYRSNIFFFDINSSALINSIQMTNLTFPLNIMAYFYLNTNSSLTLTNALTHQLYKKYLNKKISNYLI